MGLRTKQLLLQARVMVGAFFFISMALQSGFYLMEFKFPAVDRLSFLILGTLWNGILFGATFTGQNWARYMLMLLMAASILFLGALIFAAESNHFGQVLLSGKMIAFATISIAMQIAMILFLGYSPSVLTLVKAS